MSSSSAAGAPAQPSTISRYRCRRSTTRMAAQLTPTPHPIPLRRPHPRQESNIAPPLPTPGSTNRISPVKPSKIKHCDRQTEEEEYHGKLSVGHGGSATVTDILRLMDSLRFPVPPDVYASLVKECTESRDAFRGVEVHAHIQRSGILRRPGGHLLLANRLLLMYAACGCPDSASELFGGMPARDPISWAAMIAAVAGNGSYREALQMFVEMHESGCGPAAGWEEPARIIGTVTVLRSCARLRDLGFGKLVHGLVLKVWGCSSDDAGGLSKHLGSSLVHFYGVLGSRESARGVFDQMRLRDGEDEEEGI